ncbi:hypothetical protein BDN72DRAFT_941479 [Pluteus cervinus]|uniref:Uncharacterized protein n=1 Tax=Pluteus cervinus TaxID=181527 RepID=A0ACD3A347_9AGAR|nr:hypothetical protein BDN72DRAFT_941479 [Pluteus cervinus]
MSMQAPSPRQAFSPGSRHASYTGIGRRIASETDGRDSSVDDLVERREWERVQEKERQRRRSTSKPCELDRLANTSAESSNYGDSMKGKEKEGGSGPGFMRSVRKLSLVGRHKRTKEWNVVVGVGRTGHPLREASSASTDSTVSNASTKTTTTTTTSSSALDTAPTLPVSSFTSHLLYASNFSDDDDTAFVSDSQKTPSGPQSRSQVLLPPVELQPPSPPRTIKESDSVTISGRDAQMQGLIELLKPSTSSPMPLSRTAGPSKVLFKASPSSSSKPNNGDGSIPRPSTPPISPARKTGSKTPRTPGSPQAASLGCTTSKPHAERGKPSVGTVCLPSENWDDDFEFQSAANSPTRNEPTTTKSTPGAGVAGGMVVSGAGRIPDFEPTLPPSVTRMSTASSHVAEDWDAESTIHHDNNHMHISTTTILSTSTTSQDSSTAHLSSSVLSTSLANWAEPGPSTPPKRSKALPPALSSGGGATENWDDDFEDSPMRTSSDVQNPARSRKTATGKPSHSARPSKSGGSQPRPESRDEEFEMELEMGCGLANAAGTCSTFGVGVRSNPASPSKRRRAHRASACELDRLANTSVESSTYGDSVKGKEKEGELGQGFTKSVRKLVDIRGRRALPHPSPSGSPTKLRLEPNHPLREASSASTDSTVSNASTKTTTATITPPSVLDPAPSLPVPSLPSHLLYVSNFSNDDDTVLTSDSRKIPSGPQSRSQVLLPPSPPRTMKESDLIPISTRDAQMQGLIELLNPSTLSPAAFSSKPNNGDGSIPRPSTPPTSPARKAGSKTSRTPGSPQAASLRRTTGGTVGAAAASAGGLGSGAGGMTSGGNGNGNGGVGDSCEDFASPGWVEEESGEQLKDLLSAYNERVALVSWFSSTPIPFNNGFVFVSTVTLFEDHNVCNPGLERKECYAGVIFHFERTATTYDKFSTPPDGGCKSIATGLPPIKSAVHSVNRPSLDQAFLDRTLIPKPPFTSLFR